MGSRRLGLGALLLGGIAVTGLLYLLGRLKAAYYFGAFGIDLASLDLGPSDYLFESWFPVQNLFFVVLMWWIALKTRSTWVGCVAVAHALLPMAAHYAFAFHDAGPAALLIGYRHTLLKLVPFVVLIVVWLAAPRHRTTLSSPALPLPRPGLALFLLIALSWAVSTAKHSGSFDANRDLLDPAAHLARVQLRGKSVPSGPMYLVHSGKTSLVLWDASGFVYGETLDLRTFVVPRSDVERIEGHKAFSVQPGERFL